MSELLNTDDYRQWIASIKHRVQASQIKAAVSVNRELMGLYWFLGKQIIDKQESARWGDGFLKQMSDDLRAEFPEMKGFSHRNLKYMRQWVRFWSGDLAIGPQLMAQIKDSNRPQAVAQFDQPSAELVLQIPWGHNRVLMDKVDNPLDALFYVQKTIEHNWSRAVLTHHIESGLHLREGQAIKFKPEYAGKLNFYISAVDSQIRTEVDQPSIGILICKSKSDIKVEYALRDLGKPIGVSEYVITQNLPEQFKSSLPSIEEIEAELGDWEAE